jgi:hypothetical protein
MSSSSSSSSSFMMSGSSLKLRVNASEKPSQLVYVAAAFASLFGLSWGYDAAIGSSILHRLTMKGGGVELSSLQLEFFVGMMSIWSIPGVLFASAIADSAGRLKTFAVSSILLVAGIGVTM